MMTTVPRYRVKPDALGTLYYVWDDHEDTWHDGEYDDAIYAAGVPGWRTSADAQMVVNVLNGNDS
jgi:hypothetical protein